MGISSNNPFKIRSPYIGNKLLLGKQNRCFSTEKVDKYDNGRVDSSESVPICFHAYIIHNFFNIGKVCPFKIYLDETTGKQYQLRSDRSESSFILFLRCLLWFSDALSVFEMLRNSWVSY